MSTKLTNRLIFILGLLGLAVSLFLAYEYAQTGPVVCPITGTGCDTVRNSQYSSFLGLSLPYWGIGFYLLTSFLTVMLTHKSNKRVNIIRFLLTFMALAFGVYLTLLEAFVIKAYCIWCLSSFMISMILFILSMRTVWPQKSI